MKAYFAAGVAAALLLGLAANAADNASSPEKGAEKGMAALTVRTVQPVLRDWQEAVYASGWLKPWHEAVIESETSGIAIVDVLVDVGSVVTKGQPLAHLAQETVLASLHQQEATVVQAKATLAQAKANADRARQVDGSGAISAQQVTEYLITEQTSQASLASEEASLDSQKIKLKQTTIVAPDDGIISSRSASLGAVVSSGTELFRMIRQQRVEWQAEVQAQDLAKISVGQSASFSTQDGSAMTGKVRLVSPTVSTDTGRAIVYVELPTNAIARSGLYATGRVELQKSQALTVPETALVFRDGLDYVFTVNTDMTVSRHRVTIGRRQDGEVEIGSGIAATDRVVQTGGAFLSDGSLARVEN